MNMPTVSKIVNNTLNETNREPMIQLDSISVRYNLPTERIGSFKEYAIRLIQRKLKFKSFWALNDINLTVYKGEVFGIIGANGAGKSTMLKIISKVMHPTKGRVRVWGHIAPLLELGAGFHPELTGRENIFLNGALLGYSREQMEAVFDDIVSFSELNNFIEAPIRTYSSGMYARLGFAVATAHQPEILIVDEILSVGDEAFQKKCNDRMTEFRENGATVLMVSHSMDVILSMCNRVAWLDRGKLMAIGPADQVVAQYREGKP